MLLLAVGEGVVAPATPVCAPATIEAIVNPVIGVGSCAGCRASMEIVVTRLTHDEVGAVTTEEQVIA